MQCLSKNAHTPNRKQNDWGLKMEIYTSILGYILLTLGTIFISMILIFFIVGLFHAMKDQ